MDETYEGPQLADPNYGIAVCQQLLGGLQAVHLQNACLYELAQYFKGDTPMRGVWACFSTSTKHSLASKLPREEENTYQKEAMSKLLELLHKTAREYEISKLDSHLHFAALLKRIALFFVGKLALKEI